MPILKTRHIVYPGLVLFLLSLIAITVNSLCYHYPGNSYFPANTPYFALILVLIYLGLMLQFGAQNNLTRSLKEIMHFFLVMSIIAFTSNAIQYTPFPPIDKQIMAIEGSLHINMPSIMKWTNSYPTLKTVLAFIYDTLPYQMCYIPLFIIASRQIHLVREYYFLLLFSVLLGFSFYYFFPTLAPASMIDSPYFTEAQQATSLKFMQIHQYLQPTTTEGGMIAFPSFHVIWAWLCLYSVRSWPLIFMTLLPVNGLLMASCILLGWHYPLDLLGSVFVIFISHAMLKSISQSFVADPLDD